MFGIWDDHNCLVTSTHLHRSSELRFLPHPFQQHLFNEAFVQPSSHIRRRQLQAIQLNKFCITRVTSQPSAQPTLLASSLHK